MPNLLVMLMFESLSWYICMKIVVNYHLGIDFACCLVYFLFSAINMLMLLWVRNKVSAIDSGKASWKDPGLEKSSSIFV